MSTPPQFVKIYHITHVRNLEAIAREGFLRSDAVMSERGGPDAPIGMSAIKRRRLEMAVKCHAGLRVGECVPFYFCARSVMLYLLHRGNHPDVDYGEGQRPIVHLEADFHAAVAWADGENLEWAFSLSNAGARYAEFRCGAERLNEIDWEAVGNRDFRIAPVKEAKQAEFLIHDRLAWEMISRIGVFSQETAIQADRALTGSVHRPRIEVKRDWYY